MDEPSRVYEVNTGIILLKNKLQREMQRRQERNAKRSRM